MGLLRIWFWGIVHPARAFDELARRPAPLWGFVAVLIRWAGTSLTSNLLAWIRLKQPASPSHLALTFLSDEKYYAAAAFFAPVFGLGIWLLWGAIVHVVARLAGKASNFDRVLNVVGMATLIPAPVVWVWDSTMILMNRLFSPEAGVGHVLLGVWGIALFTIGLRRELKIPVWAAAVLTLIIFIGVYVPLAMLWMR